MLASARNKSLLQNSYYNWWGEGTERPPSLHAEVATLRRCSKTDLKNAVIYIARINRLGEERNSKPCPACLEEIRKAGIRKIVFTTGESCS